MKKFTFKFLAMAMFFLMGTAVMAQTQYSITFKVDMTGVETFNPDTDALWMSGNFAGWAEPGSDEAFKMAPMETGSMFYVLTATIDSGEVQYKYFKSSGDTINWSKGEWDGDPNRKIYIRQDETVENMWANKPQDVTFLLDMTDADPFNPETDAVYIAGTLASNWAMPGSLSPYMLTPTETGSLFYTVTLSLSAKEYQYKYFRVIDGEASWDNGEATGTTNRIITTDTVAATFEDIWGDMNSGIFGQPNVFTYSMYPNPVVTVLNIDNTSDVNLVEVFDVTGKLVRTIQVALAQSVTIDVAELQEGVYIVNVTNDKGTQTSKFIKN